MENPSNQIRNFIQFSYEYQRKKTDKNSMQIQRQIQVLSVVSDLSSFEPTCNVTLEFYICLEMLLVSADPKSTLSWKVIMLLNHLSQSQNIRLALRDDIKFVPILSEYMQKSKLSLDKTHKLLLLIESLSYKLKITYAEGWVISLVRYLADIVKSESGDLFFPAISVLGNLCRSNPPVLACLRNYALVKPMFHRLVNMKNPSIKESLLAAEIMLYLDKDLSKLGRNPTNEQVTSVVNCILHTGKEGCKENEISYLRLATDVFTEIAAYPNLADHLKEWDFSTFTNDLMKHLNADTPAELAEVFFDLLYLIIDLDLPNMQPAYEEIFKRAAKWISSRKCCLSALRVLRTLIVMDKRFIDSPLTEDFVYSLTDIMDLSEVMHVSSQKLQHINKILVLLEELCNFDTALRVKLATSFQAFKFNALLIHILGIDSSMHNNETLLSNTLDTSCINTWKDKEFTTVSRISKMDLEDNIAQAVVNTMTVVKLLGSHNGDFIIEYNQMLSNPSTMKYIVHCERSHNHSYIAKAVKLMSNDSIPNESLIAIVKSIEENNKCQYKTKAMENSVFSHTMGSATFSPESEAQVDNLIERLKGIVEKKELKDVCLTSVMDMYEYKFAAMSHTKLTLETALQGADTRYRQTHISLLQVQAQADQLTQLLSVWEKRFNTAQQEKADMESNIQEIQKSSKVLREKLVNEKTALERRNQELLNDLKSHKSHIEAQNETINKMQSRQQEAMADIKNLQRIIKEEEDKYFNMQSVVKKLEDDIKTRGKNFENMEKAYHNLEKCLADVKSENAEMELLMQNHEETIAAKELELENVNQRYLELKRIQDLIHSMSAKGSMN